MTKSQQRNLIIQRNIKQKQKQVGISTTKTYVFKIKKHIFLVKYTHYCGISILYCFPLFFVISFFFLLLSHHTFKAN